MDINPVLLEDDADFQCQVGATREVNAIRSVDAHLTVTVPPEPPIIYNGAKITTVETRTVEIRCSSRGGKPVAEVRYIINRKFIIFCRQGLKSITEGPIFLFAYIPQYQNHIHRFYVCSCNV